MARKTAPHQYWSLVNIDKILQSVKWRWSKLGEFFWDADPEVLNRLSTTVDLSERPKLMPKDKRLVVQTSILLTKIPMELLQAIAKLLFDDFVDLTPFSLVCVTMWNVAEGIRFLYLRTELQRRSWNGNRIILLGSYTGNLPQGLLTKEDREKLKAMVEIQKPRFYDEEDLADDDDVSLLNDALYKAGEKAEENHLDDDDWIHRLVYSSPDAVASCYPDVSSFTLRHAPSTSEAEDRWILRNLTRKEFVIKSKDNSSRALEQALFSLICWSDNDSDMYMRCDNADTQRMIRGPWAGDRIDMTLYSLHEHKNDPDWKDITKEVLVFLERLAQSNGDQQTFLEDVLPSF